MTVEVGECVELETPEERLACFEARVEAARGKRAAESPARAPERPASAPESPARAPERPARVDSPAAGSRAVVPSSPVDSENGSRSRREEREERAAGAEIVAKVAELRETVPNAYLITLDNGQVWRQTLPGRYPLRPGSDVRIYPSKWLGAYRLTNPELRGFIQVERVR